MINKFFDTFFYTFFDTFSFICSYLPEVNTLIGLIFYSLLLIFFRIIFMNLLKLIYKKFYSNNDIDNFGDNYNEYNRNFELGNGNKFGELSQQVIENRKKKAKEAIEYLKKSN
jgi:hypothetical protein